MKAFLNHNKRVFIFLISSIIVWRLFLYILELISPILLRQREGYIGQIPWANFDGLHYLSIAQHGYFQYEQAFFPLFPLVIKQVSFLTFNNLLWAGMIVVYVFFFLFAFIFYKLLQLDYKERIVRWIVIFMLFFPTSFFFISLYTESLFLFLVIMAFFTARKKRWLLSAFFVGLASATKLVGVFLLPAILFEYFIMNKNNLYKPSKLFQLVSISIVSISGLMFYMIYLWRTYGDPLFFIHAQPAFGANRSGGEIILLPQVIFRYVKILLTVPFSNYDVWIALLEFAMLLLSLTVLITMFYKKRIRTSYLIFSFLAIIGPTLTGSLSSIPRYVLAAFPLFIFFGSINDSKTRIVILFFSIILLAIMTCYFTQGYFIS